MPRPVVDDCGRCGGWLCEKCCPSTFAKLDFRESVMLSGFGSKVREWHDSKGFISRRLLRRMAELVARQDPSVAEMVMEALDYAVQERQREEVAREAKRAANRARVERRRAKGSPF